jgi:hypothetical protein
MKRNNLFLIILFFTIGRVYGQEIKVSSNNLEDQNNYSNTIGTLTSDEIIYFSEKMNLLENGTDYFYNKTITFQVVLLDPNYIGSIELADQHIVKDEFIEYWKEKYSSENRILIYFIKDNEEYILNEWDVTNEIETHQIFNEVKDYINTEIIDPEIANGNSTIEIIPLLIKVLANAFDQTYKHKLITIGPQMLNIPEYYQQGSTGPPRLNGWDYFYYEPEILEYELFINHDDNETTELKHVYKYLYENLNATTVDLINSELICYLDDNNNKVTIDLIGNENKFYYYNSENELSSIVVPEDESFDEFLQNYFVIQQSKCCRGCVEYTDLYDSLPNAKTWATRLYKSKENFLDRWQPKNEIKGINNESGFLYSSFPRFTFTIVKVYSGHMEPSILGEVYEYENGVGYDMKYGFSCYGGHFSRDKKSYCDVYAADLQNDIFDLTTYLPGGTSNIINEMRISEDYKDVTSLLGGPDKIWTNEKNYDVNFNKIWNFVDAGFMVYYVSPSDHIETCFPREPAWTGVEYTIGAGSEYKKKEAEEYNFDCNIKSNKVRGVHVFLYLAHLKTNIY